jgi:DNA polymerase-3 subunit alpha
MSDFVHLHVHSHFSLLDSTVKLKPLCRRVADLGMHAVAVTDHHNLFHCIELQKTASALAKDDRRPAKLRPIFGVELNVVPDRHAEARALRPGHLVLLAETLDGYRNLVQLVSLSQIRPLDRTDRPVVDHAELQAHAEGVIALSGDIGGEIPQALLRGRHDDAEALARRMVGIFGAGNFFLEVERHPGLPEFQEACTLLADLGRRLDIPLVATNNTHYLNEGDHVAHGVLMCIGMDRRADPEVLRNLPLQTLWLRSPDEMHELFADLPDALANTVRIADRCQVTIPTGQNFLPRFPLPDNIPADVTDEAALLRLLAHRGLDARVAEARRLGLTLDEATYRPRLDFELDVIIQMGFPGYFLIVQDFINWAKEQGIPVGPGRGSGAGSLVAWSLRITDLDPIPYGLLFERFLNPERVSMPDFDIDFCQDRRGEVIDYVTRKYGADNVGLIVTYGQLKARAVLRDVARVLDYAPAEANQIIRLVPDKPGTRLQEAIEAEPRLREAVSANPTNGLLWELALALEGNNRNTGLHAAGVVIGDEPLWHYVPVFRDLNTGFLVSQYAKNEVEAAGLVKFDFLGLKTLTVIQDAVRLANQGRPLDQALDLDAVGFEDPAVYELISSGDTIGVFQLESEGFQKLLRQLRPDRFEDIIAAVALYRPGPLNSGMVTTFCDCKHGRHQPDYPHPSLESVLRETYGVMVYQEQVMQVAQILAGYSLGGADMLRRAMGKKDADAMNREENRFVEGAMNQGVDEPLARHIFNLMRKFSEYGFNKSHSAAYAVLTWQTAWLKTHEPTAFYAALMTNDAGNTPKVVRYIQNARARGIRILPPDVNLSSHSFSVQGDVIRFGFSAIKGVGAGPIEALTEGRADNPYASLDDLCQRVNLRLVSRRVLETLILAGALDTLHPHTHRPLEGAESALHRAARVRAQLTAALPQAIERAERARRDRDSGQGSLFGMLADAASLTPRTTYDDTLPPMDDREVLLREKQTLGFYLSGHPLDRHRHDIELLADTTTQELEQASARQKVRVAAVITRSEERPLRSGKGRMATLDLEDHWGEARAVIYDRTLQKLPPDWATEEPVLVEGIVRIDEGDEGESAQVTLVIDSLMPLWKARTEAVHQARFRIDALDADPDRIDRLVRVLLDHPGPCTALIHLVVPGADVQVEIPADIKVSADEAMVRAVCGVLGEGSVRFA